jgi:hypothetical protein
MSAADIYRRHAVECLSMAQRQENSAWKAELLEMAAMWQRLAEHADKNEGPDEPPPAL